LAAAHSFAIEYEGMASFGPLPAALSSGSLVKIMQKLYSVSGALLQDLRDLVEIRNEIIHPVPLPPGAPDNWPHYLRRVKEKGLLTTTGDSNADYVLLGQIASHRLFTWAAEVTKGLYAAVIKSNDANAEAFLPFLENFKNLFG